MTPHEEVLNLWLNLRGYFVIGTNQELKPGQRLPCKEIGQDQSSPQRLQVDQAQYVHVLRETTYQDFFEQGELASRHGFPMESLNSWRRYFRVTSD